MPIREKGYYNWDGKLQDSKFKWLPIFFYGVKNVYRKRFSKMLFATSASIFFLFLLLVFAASKPELKGLFDVVRNILNLKKDVGSDSFIFDLFYTNGFLIFMMMLMSLFAGSEQISSDIKHKSITLYLSRPIHFFEYIAGKFSIVLFYLLLFTLVPGVLLFFARIIFSGKFSVPIYILFGSIIYPVIVSFFLASLMLMLSSLTSNWRLVKVFFWAVYIVTSMVAEIFAHELHNSRFLFFSIEKNFQQLGAFIFKTNPIIKAPGWISAIILLGFSLLFFFIMYKRIKKAEK